MGLISARRLSPGPCYLVHLGPADQRQPYTYRLPPAP